jgi:hypothetical protein
VANQRKFPSFNDLSFNQPNSGLASSVASSLLWQRLASNDSQILVTPGEQAADDRFSLEK